MNKISDRQMICEVLMQAAQQDSRVMVLCSDSRGSASLIPFAQAFPKQFVEVGIAEQDMVSIAAGLASCGMKPFVVSPACFLSTRSYEQVKIDCAYSDTNVKLLGISGGISYGALGMSHHSLQDIAAMSALPNMRVYLPSDRFQTERLMEALLQDEKPAYVRVGRGPVEDVYEQANCPFTLDRATVLRQGKDVLLVACGEMVRPAMDAAELLQQQGVICGLLDMCCVKPLDTQTLLQEVQNKTLVVTVEEHSAYGGLGAMVSQVVSCNCPHRVISLSLPDQPVITGTPKEVFQYYGLDAKGIAQTVREAVQR